MCGIAGLFRVEGGIRPEDAAAVERATSAQSHRGPDDCGYFRDERVVLGHRRLSIIDLSPAGHQPMSNEDGTVWVTYNGEIYNYRDLRPELSARGHGFRSNSDTEILIHGYEEWGIEGLLKRLRGMYAFALYDSRQACSILARDRLGIKPLYYFQPPRREVLAFASEVKALVRSGIAPAAKDPEGLIGFLLFGSVPSPATANRHVRCLMPGHYLTVGRSGSAVRRYWDLDSETDSQVTRKETEEDLRLLLEDSVERHLVSDVPLGVFLSGGVDSAGLVALASRRRHRLVTLTVVFDEEEFSEAAAARRVAEHFGTDHRQVRVTRKDFMRELPNVLEAMDQPSNDGVNTYFVSQAARQAGLTVVLSGLGGDEVFWGYKHYRWLTRCGAAVRCFSGLPASLRNSILRAAAAYGRHVGRDRWARLAFLENRVSGEALYVALRGFFAPEQVSRLLGLGLPEVTAVAQKYLTDPEQAGSRRGIPARAGDAHAFNYLELKRYMHDQLLRDTDVFSMAHSIEARVPYLDHLVVERAARVLASMKLERGTNKPLLVNAVAEPLVRDAAAARKRGFTFPFAQWMGEAADQLEGMALESGALEKAGVRQCWKNFREGHVHWSRAWALAVLGAAG
jgi:asparagine synthase (glutamine-hydrolysing)